MTAPTQPHDVLDDGHGSKWQKCGPNCELEIVRPGKVQCEKDDCPMTTSEENSQVRFDTPTQSETSVAEVLADRSILSAKFARLADLAERLESSLTAERAARLELQHELAAVREGFQQMMASRQEYSDAAVAAERALAEARRDAERYHWLKGRCVDGFAITANNEQMRTIFGALGGHSFDAAIDAALAGRGERDASS